MQAKVISQRLTHEDALLKREPNPKLLVVGHTVANALVTGFGIEPDRLVPFGVSYAAPVWEINLAIPDSMVI